MKAKSIQIDIRVFYRLFFPYLIVLSIALLTTLIYFYISQKFVIQNVKDNSSALIRNGISINDQRLSDAQRQVSKLLSDRNVTGFYNIGEDLQPEDYLEMQMLTKKVGNYLSREDGFIASAFLYYAKSRVFITETSATARSEVSYNSYILYNDLDFEKWLEYVFSSESINAYYPPSAKVMSRRTFTDNTIGYIRLVPRLARYPSEKNSYHGFVMLLFSEMEIQKPFLNSPIVENGCLFIMDADNNILTYINNDDQTADYIRNILVSRQNINDFMSDNKIKMIYDKSNFTEWRYIAGVDTSLLLKETRTLKNVFFAILFLGFFISIIISFALAYKVSTHMSKIVKELQVMENDVRILRPGVNIYSFVEGRLNQLILRNKNIFETMGVRQKLILQSFVEKLFRGTFITRSEFEKIYSDIYPELNAFAYVVLAFQLDSFNDACDTNTPGNYAVLSTSYTNIISDLIEKKGVVSPMNDNKIAVLLYLNNDQEQMYIVSTAQKILDELRKMDNLCIYIGVGNICHNLWDVQNSSSQAFEVLENLPANEYNHIEFYDSLKTRRLNFFYSYEREIQLVSLVKRSSHSEVDGLLSDIFKANKELGFSFSEFKQFYHDLRSTAIRLSATIIHDNTSEMNLFQENLAMFDRSASLDELHSATKKLFSLMCDLVQQRKRSHKDTLKNQILTYIMNNYSDSNLSLQMISSKFGMSEKYLSNFIKDQTGDNISTIIENTRMKRALELLIQGETIEKVSCCVGYNSTNTFYRAFRRVYRCSPSTYRETEAINSYEN